MVWSYPIRPATGPNKHLPWEKLRFRPEQFEDLLEHCPSVEAFTRRTWLATPARHGSRVLENVDVIGIDPAWHEIGGQAVILGRPFTHLDCTERRLVCLIPPKVRDKLLLDRDCLGEPLLLGGRTFRIVGVVEPPATFELFGGRPQEEIEIYVPFETIYNGTDRYLSNIRAIAKSPQAAAEAVAEITFFLRRTRNIQAGDPDTFRVDALQRRLEVFNKIAAVITGVTAAIVGVSLLVGGIGIMNIMLVSVSERTREIGLRKAVGARPAAIMLQFLIEAVVLCLVGGLVGVGVGQLLTKGIASIPNAQLEKAYIPLWAVVVSFGFATLVGLFFGFFPAVKAARLNPIEALRHE
jgi:putative ABC transport system permease protein